MGKRARGGDAGGQTPAPRAAKPRRVGPARGRQLALAGRLEDLKTVVTERGCELGVHLCNGAAEGGHQHVLEWLRQQGCPWDASVCAAAARGGHTPLLQWLRQQGCPWDASLYEGAAEGGHLSLLRWVRGQDDRPDWNDRPTWNRGPVFPSVLIASARWGRVDVLEWLAGEEELPEELPERDSELIARVAGRGGQLRVLQWLENRNPQWKPHPELCLDAAMGGHLEIIKWARERGVPWDGGRRSWQGNFIRDAARHHDVLKWALEHGHPPHPDVCYTAARNDSLATLKLARRHGCGWDGDTLSYIARRATGGLELIRWALEQGCPVYNEVRVAAADAGRADVMRLFDEFPGSVRPDPRAPPEGELCHFEVLGLRPGASWADVRNSYLRLALVHHPDKPGGNADSFTRVDSAYKALMGSAAPP